MRNTLILILLLCISSAAKADGGPAAPDDSMTPGAERFEVAVKGFSGAQIDVHEIVVMGRRRSIRTATSEGAPVAVDILIREGENGKKLLELKVVELTANGPDAVVSFSDLLGPRPPAPPRRPGAPDAVVSFSDLLAPGESNIAGSGWNNLYEVRLSRADGPR